MTQGVTQGNDIYLKPQIVHHTLMSMDNGEHLEGSRPTPAPADSGSAARAQARFARNGAMMRRSLASPAAAAEPLRWAAKNSAVKLLWCAY